VFIRKHFKTLFLHIFSFPHAGVFWFPRWRVNAIKLSQGEHRFAPTVPKYVGFVGAYLSALNLMAVTLARGNQKK
jgi:hypothetical protein